VFFDAYQYIRSQQQNQTSGSVVEASSDLLQNELGFPKYWPKVRYSGLLEMASFFARAKGFDGRRNSIRR
jgi:hypothetical protein